MLNNNVCQTVFFKENCDFLKIYFEVLENQNEIFDILEHL
jgi:hypothetical protein